MIQLRYYCNDYLEKYSRTYLLFKTTYWKKKGSSKQMLKWITTNM
jgi:hypothetical protein